MTRPAVLLVALLVAFTGSLELWFWRTSRSSGHVNVSAAEIARLRASEKHPRPVPTATRAAVRARAREIVRLVAVQESRHSTGPASALTREREVAWMRSAPTGLFIHFGPSSALAAPSDASWWTAAQSAAGRRAARGFAPSPSIADGWVNFAKQLRVSYITVTAKHHDGFALWPTKMSTWAVSSTHDVIGRITADARKAHLRVFLYYSLLDWHEPTYARDASAYLAFVEGQLRELLTWYGPIAGVWFDGSWAPHGLTDRQLEQVFAFVHRLQPWALVGNNGHRHPLGGEDFQIFEGGLPGGVGTIGVTQPVGLPEQSAVKLGATWFWDGHPDPVSGVRYQQLVRQAKDQHVSLLADVAPDPSGQIPAETRRALLSP